MKSFIKAGNQTPFGFLEEIKHLAVTIAGTTNALPQVFLFHLLSDSRLPGLARMITWLWLFMERELNCHSLETWQGLY